MNIIELARVAGCHDNGSEFRFVELRYLERFAALVRAAALDEAAGIAKHRLLADGSDKEKQAHWTACQNISAAIQQLKTGEQT